MYLPAGRECFLTCRIWNWLLLWAYKQKVQGHRCASRGVRGGLPPSEKQNPRDLPGTKITPTTPMAEDPRGGPLLFIKGPTSWESELLAQNEACSPNLALLLPKMFACGKLIRQFHPWVAFNRLYSTSSCHSNTKHSQKGMVSIENRAKMRRYV